MKSKKLAYISSGVFIILIAFVAIIYLKNKQDKATFEKKDYAQIAESGILRIVTNLDQTGYFVSGDTIAGFNHDLLKALQKYTNLKFEISVENSLEKSFEELKFGKYDLIARNIQATADMKGRYLFTTPIILNKLILVQRKAEYNDSISPIRSHLQLAGKTLHIAKDAPSKLRLANLSHEIGDTVYIKENDLYDTEQLAMMVSTGEIGYTISDFKTAEALARKMPELDIETSIGFTHLESWAVNQWSPILLDSLNTWIDKFKQTKDYQIIYNRYYK
ncbi:transporter substrate-binding domain-containing protein [Dysgonomonas sp. 520]|uniref:transporter substrate-binding domain-containing protein n=1 Tax=Dysgonomonas sp. 520 TaxID=2302931 RepID=UPI0013D6CD83|nr:transporter substrate-binding domain-containing protein [Dysgonomonas sp. 520]NDW10568.1 glutamine ABC transporter substrate-binding protein [Dysgonomonas sp. 520]